MGKKSVKFYNYNLELIDEGKAHGIVQSHSLEYILDKYSRDMLGKNYAIIPGERFVKLVDVSQLDDVIFFKYENVNYGELKPIKKVVDSTSVGTLNKDEYVEEFQTVGLIKCSDGSYDFTIQSKQTGMSYIKFYNKINNYLESFKQKNVNNLENSMLNVFSYRRSDFFKQLENYNAYSIEISGEAMFNDSDIKFSGKGDEVCITKYTHKIRTKKNTLNFLDKYQNTAEYVKHLLEKNPGSSITVKGKNNGPDAPKKLHSDTIDSFKEVRIPKDLNGRLSCATIKAEIKKILEKKEEDSYNRIKTLG